MSSVPTRSRYRTGSEELDARLADLLDEVGATQDRDQLFEILVSAVRLAHDDAGWRVASEEPVDGQPAAPWLAMPGMRVERGEHAVVGGAADGPTLAETVATVDAVLPGLAERWDGTPRHVLVLLPRTPGQADTLLGRHATDGSLQLDEMRLSDDELREVDKIIVLACGTSFYAGLVAKYAIEHWTRIPCEVELASEFRYRDPIVDATTLVVAISQSGETMDTLMAVQHAREQGSRVLAIVNTHGSTIPRESDAVLYTHAGPEIAVASTKAFLAQITAAYLLGLYMAELRGNMFHDEVVQILDELRELPAKIQQVIDRSDRVREVARWMADTPTVLFPEPFCPMMTIFTRVPPQPPRSAGPRGRPAPAASPRSRGRSRSSPPRTTWRRALSGFRR